MTLKCVFFYMCYMCINGINGCYTLSRWFLDNTMTSQDLIIDLLMVFFSMTLIKDVYLGVQTTL